MNQFDPSSLPDFAQRVEAARLHEAFYAVWTAALDADENNAVPTEEYERLMRSAEKSRMDVEAYCKGIGRDLMTDMSEQIKRCAACGVPLWESDETLNDFDTDETFLRAALDLPPRPARSLLPDMEEV